VLDVSKGVILAAIISKDSFAENEAVGYCSFAFLRTAFHIIIMKDHYKRKTIVL
jgi:hypothetical protein